MKHITTKFLRATATKTARIKATASTGLSATVTYDYGLGTLTNHVQAVTALMDKLHWEGKMIVSGTDTGYIAVFSHDTAVTFKRNTKGQMTARIKMRR